MKKLLFLFALLFFVPALVPAQVRFSIATSISLLRNFSPHQQFWAFGQAVEGQFHFTRKNTAYAWIDYHTQGRFSNSFTAFALSPSTTPDRVPYLVTGQWRFRQVSLGWKHYLRGAFNEEQKGSFYGSAGLGLLFAKATNSLASPLDMTLYRPMPVPQMDSDEFKRLTLDLSLGTEVPLASGFFAYGNLRTSLPASDYPSPFFHSPQHVPFVFTLNLGMRILFGPGED